MRQLFYMVRGKCREAWDHTAALLALSINQNRKKSSHAVKANDLNPYRCNQKQQPTVKLNSKDSMKLLKAVFIDHKTPSIENLMQGKIE